MGFHWFSLASWLSYFCTSVLFFWFLIPYEELLVTAFKKKIPRIRKISVFVCLFCRFKTKQKAKKGFEKAKAYKWVLRLIGYLSLFLRWKCWGPLSLSSWAMKTHPLTLLTTWSITSMKTVKISTLFFYFFPSVYVRPLVPVWLLRKKLVLLSKALLPVMGFAKFLFFWFPQQSRGTISV